MGSTVSGVAGWRGYFKGGAEFDSASSAWSDMPKTGCLFVAVYFLPKRTNRRMMQANDWYFRQVVAGGDVIYGHTGSGNEMSAADVLAVYPGAELIAGEWATDEEMDSTSDRAFAASAP